MQLFTRRASLLALAPALAMVGPACSDDSIEQTESELTYYRDIKPILDAKCVSCHFAGGVAPFSLETFEDAAAHAGASAFAIEQGEMPPWQPNDECADYVGDLSLLPEQSAAIIEWARGGAREGDPATEGEPLPDDGLALTRVDLTMTMPEPYTPQPALGETDDYRCFVLPWNEPTTVFVAGFGALPGNEAVVHHVIAFLAEPGQRQTYLDLDAADAGPGYRCFGGPEGPAREWLGGWAPGSLGSDLPPGLGLRVEPGSTIILQVHYNTLAAATTGEIAPDTTAIELKLEDEVAKEARILPWANPAWLIGENMRIPANDPDVAHSFAADPTLFLGMQEMEIHAVGLHLHLLGKSGRVSIERSGGGSDCLLQIDDWDFDWQGAYAFAAPRVLARGDQLRLECHWDNSAQNQPVVDGEQRPPQDVFWGEGSTDEMCLGTLLVAER